MAAPTANPLSAGPLGQYMAASLPEDARLTNPAEVIALATHAGMLSIGFRLIGLGEHHKIDTQSDPAEPSPLPTEWNATKGSYAFRYKHSQSSMEFLVKVNSMGNKVHIMGMGMGDDKTSSFDVKAQDYVSDGNLPATPVAAGGTMEEARRKMVDVFISNGRLSDFASLMRIELIQKLMPSLHKEGYEETQQAHAQPISTRQPAPGREGDRPARDPLREEWDPPARPHPFADPLAQPRRGPLPDPIPDGEDEFEIQRGPRMPQGIPPGAFPNIGWNDVYPQGLGPNDPLRGGVGPGLGGMGGGGMHPTFDDPLFAGQGQRGRGYDPQAPPGSRYDDPGPGFGGLPGNPRGSGMGGRPPNPFGGFGGNDFI